MPVTLQCPALPLTTAEVERLWQQTMVNQAHGDESVTVRCVSSHASRTLNRRYRHRASPTNVLTFSYEAAPHSSSPRREHDIALCLPVARQEAAGRSAPFKHYVAWLLVHAFLHATGLDHESSSPAAMRMQAAEQAILGASGWPSQSPTPST